MNKILISILTLSFLCSCNLSKEDYYKKQMKKKGFSLISNGPCDDALDDTTHERYVAYFDSQVISDSTAIIEFKFIDACCQQFLGDYSIKNDVLNFQLEQVNEEACSCLCWYRYKLSINDKQMKQVSKVIVNQK